MALRDLFRRPQPIRTLGDIDDFVDTRGAFVVQKSIFEFSRAAAGYMWQPMFKEPTFLEALETARWRSYPFGLSCVAELIFNDLRAGAAERAPDLAQSLARAVERVVERYPLPPGISAPDWRAAVDGARERIARASIAVPRRTMDIAASTSPDIFALMPIHKRVRGSDDEFVRNNLVMSLMRVHEEFAARADMPALTRLLLADVPADPRPPTTA